MVDGDGVTPATQAKLLAELRRGVLVLAVLSRLRTPQYGYSLRQALDAGGMPVEEGTLYPLLRRLESQGALQSSWNTEGSSPRRYYWLSAEGHHLYRTMSDSWRRQVEVMDTLLG
jgi:PadR family transcriptional regulator, regulatory protein PadR